MKVEIKDRKTETEYLRAALNLVEIFVDYPTTDLIIRTQEKLKELGGDFTIKDAIKVERDWKNYWDNYKKLNDNRK